MKMVRCIAVCEDGHRWEKAIKTILQGDLWFGINVKGVVRKLWQNCPKAKCGKKLREETPPGDPNETVKV